MNWSLGIPILAFLGLIVWILWKFRSRVVAHAREWPVWLACVVVPTALALWLLAKPTPWYVASTASLVALCPYCVLSLFPFVQRWHENKEKWSTPHLQTLAMLLLFIFPAFMGAAWFMGGLFGDLAQGKWASVNCSFVVMAFFLLGDWLGEKYTSGTVQQAYARNVRYLDLPFFLGLFVLVGVNALSLWFALADPEHLAAFTGGASALQLVVQNTAYALTNSEFDRSPSNDRPASASVGTPTATADRPQDQTAT